MSRKLAGALALIAALSVAQPSPAQAPGAAPKAPPASANPRSEALIRRVLTAMEIDKQMDAMLSAMLPGLVAQQPQNGLSDADRKLIMETTLETMREVVTPRLIEAIIPIYAEHYTEAELQALATFYESPMGRSIMAKTPSLAPKVSAATQQLMPAAIEEMMVRLCRKVDCTPEGPKPRRS